MKIGVTGTRKGMNENQRDSVTSFLRGLSMEFDYLELHHGNCVGVDVEVAEIAKELGFRIVSHPGPKSQYSGKNDEVNDETRETLPYFTRNRRIVNETNFLLVVPFEDTHQNKGGTWYTYDYALKKGKPMRIFYPHQYT